MRTGIGIEIEAFPKVNKVLRKGKKWLESKKKMFDGYLISLLLYDSDC